MSEMPASVQQAIDIVEDECFLNDFSPVEKTKSRKILWRVGNIIRDRIKASAAARCSADSEHPVAWRYTCQDGSQVLMLKPLTSEQKRRGYYIGEDGEDEVGGDDAIIGPFHWAQETPLYAAPQPARTEPQSASVVHDDLIALNGDLADQLAGMQDAAETLLAQYDFGAGHCLGVMSDGKACFKGSFLEKLEALKTALAHCQAVSAPLASNASDPLETLEGNCWDLRCIDIPTGGGDADIGWNIVEHHMGPPKERIVGRGRSPREALQDATSTLSRPQCEGK